MTVAAPSAKEQKKLADSMERKIASIRQNGERPDPQKQTTVFEQDEVNAYFAERRVKMPGGVKVVTFGLGPNSVTSHALIDFDEITRDRRSRNPLMYLFTGTHNVDVVARTEQVRAGKVRVNVESVAIDGVAVPRMALDFFIDRFVSPKYPNVGLNREYTLPAKLDAVLIAPRKGTAIQK